MKAAVHLFEARIADLGKEHEACLTAADDLVEMMALAKKLPNKESLKADIYGKYRRAGVALMSAGPKGGQATRRTARSGSGG